MNSNRLLKPSEVAELLCVRGRTVLRLVERGELPSVHVGRALRFHPTDVRGLVEAGRTTTSRARHSPTSAQAALRLSILP